MLALVAEQATSAGTHSIASICRLSFSGRSSKRVDFVIGPEDVDADAPS